MALLKLGRESYAHKEDNLLDAAGYIGLAEDLPEPDIELDAEDKISALQKQVETLEKEADWLAKYIGHHVCVSIPEVTICPAPDACANCWREAAPRP